MLLQLKGRRCQIALDLSIARWGLYPGLEKKREFFAMVFKVLFLSYFIVMLLQMISVYLKHEGALYKEVFPGKIEAHLSVTVKVRGSNSKWRAIWIQEGKL